MDQAGPARQSSGIYDANYDSQHSFSSQVDLREHAAQPAGVATRTAAGVPLSTAEGDARGGMPSGSNAEPGDAPDDAPQTQPQQPRVPLYKRRWFIITSAVLSALGIALLFILLFPVIRAIVQLVVNRSQIDVERAVIMNASNDSFQLTFQGNVTHTGIFSASIKFTNQVDVYWLKEPDTNSTGMKLGHTDAFEALHATHKRAKVDQTRTFTIEDQAAFSEFTRFMITSPSFSWRLHSNDLHVQALKFPVAKGIEFNKRVDLQGINGFSNNVALLDFKLPSDNPAGGLDFIAVTQLNNTSPFVLELGTTVFDLSYQGVFLGSGTSSNTSIDTGLNNITLKGVLEPVQNPADLVKVSNLFTNYLNGDLSNVTASGRSTFQNDGTVVQWLSDGLQALQLNVPFMTAPINPIRTIDIGNLALAFSPETPWTPAAASDSVRATLQLPFGFGLSIGEIKNNFSIVSNGAQVAGLSTPLGASTSSITVLGEADTQGTINITIANTNLTCPDPQHPAFSTFNANLTSSDVANFRLVGNSRAIANLSIGQITLDPIKVNVSTQLQGLQGLKGMTQIQGVDVAGGTTDHINLNINVTISNPSNLNLSTGDLTLQLSRDGVALGTALLPNLDLRMGNNSISATSAFRANDSPQGQQTLNDFVGKKDVELTISGFNGSTNVPSLAEAFETLEIGVTLPGLKTNLLESAGLKVLPTTGRENNISHVTVSLNNPFTAPLRITRISSTVTSHGIPLGVIETNTDFNSAPHSTTQSPELELNMNFDPAALFTLTRVLAVEAGLDPAPLDGIVQLGGIQYLTTSGQPPVKRQDASVFAGFNLPTFVQTAFKKLQSDVQLTSEVSIGDFNATLQYTQTAVPTATDDSLNLILPILAQPIVNRIVAGAGLGIDTVLITDPKQEAFGTHLRGSISNAGPFDAKIAFPSGLNVAWQGSTLGNIKMDAVQVTGDVGATLDNDATFNVADVGVLTNFAKVLLTEESFDWQISGDNLSVNALGIDVPGITFPAKQVNLKGFNGLKGGVNIKSFDLPSNDPAGGIHLTLQASATNPSDVGIQLDSLGFNTFSGNIMIAPVAASGGVTLAPRSTSNLSLVGRLVPQTSSDGLAEVSQIFNNFVAGKTSDVMVEGASAGPSSVTWLNEGIKSLKVDTVLPDQGPQNIIKSITLNQMDLRFTEATAYSPSTSSQSTDAAFTLPFNFPLDITALEQTITLSYQGTSFGQLAIPKGPSSTDVENRIIHLKFENVPLDVSDGAHSTFERFLADTTVGARQVVGLSGIASADASTAVGVLSLTGISFSVDSVIEGLQGLNTRPVTVSNLDVNHGFPDFLLIKVDGTLFNPSNLTIGTGDVSFDLQFQDKTIGTANIQNLVITPGAITPAIDVHYAPQGDAVSSGRTLLQDFLQGINVDTAIVGSTSATDIQSLQQALSQIRLSPVTIPALNTTLIKSVSLTFPINIVDTGIATTKVTISNPFTASINLLRVEASASFHNVSLGSVPNIDLSSNPIRAEGHSEVTSPGLPFKFNLDPVAIISLLQQSSAQNGVSLGPLNDLFQFVLDNPNFKPPVKTTVDTSKPTCVSGHQFDATGAILKSLANLRVDLDVDTGTKLDDFATDLTFAQKSVPAVTDETTLFLIGAVAGPVAQHLVDGAVLAFKEADITNISNDGFDLSLKGSLTNVGPLDALIEFVEPLTVTWQGKAIAQISLPPVCAAANDGVPDYETNGRLTITNQDDFTAFAGFLLHNEEFVWTISTDKLRLRALGTIFDNIALSKDVTFKAFNNLPGVTISNFQLPSDDPAGGIHVETDAMIPSPAQLGLELGHVTFDAFFQDVLVGPLAADNLTLKPQAVAQTHLSGRIVPQSGNDLNTIGFLFSEFLAGRNTTLETRGDSVQPPGADGPVTWLSTAFKTLSLNVVLPGQKFDVIKSIQLNDLEVTIRTADQAFAPPASSKNTVAQYANPFGFSLQVVEAAQTLDLNMGGVNIAELDLPKMAVSGGVSTGNTVDLPISFENQTLKSLNDNAFAQLFAGVTLMSSVSINLKGSADVTARTPIGDVPINGIPIDVTSSLKGIAAFNHQATLTNVSVAGSGGQGGSEFILSPLTTTLQNPSNISLDTVGVSLPVIYQGTKIGRAAINEFDLVPGENVVPTEFHYEPDNANDTVAQDFLTQFIQTGNKLDLTIDGDAQSSPFGSLQPALDGVTISTSIMGLNHPAIISSAHVVITLDSLVTNLVSVEFQVTNPLDTEMVIEFVQANSGLDGLTYAFFDQGFNSFAIPPGQTVGSGLFGNVLLTQGAIASLAIIPRGILDISAANTVRIGGPNGYQIPWLKLMQTGVPTTYDLQLSLQGVTNTLDGLLDKVKEILSGNHAPSVIAAASSIVASASANGGEAALTKSPAPSASSSVVGGTTAGGKSSDAPVPVTSATTKATSSEAPAEASVTTPAKASPVTAAAKTTDSEAPAKASPVAAAAKASPTTVAAAGSSSAASSSD
ncbi:hypothetical protein P691DRAFT_757432 [Macrolepiota fuliginosa MF-IS2]|uniref:Uncharacterized protein n=1 Tax=Macrolepiota fuliginosa MF-IS2 TaxID=1400762 RepID=A0A9P6C7F9_9AGAR|nr:hypothetical protein P691DRAFT_757432 [Macrolepiota fuliginosa MF-IS2]